jgi:hydroxymethylglutaryl-CoA lyase
MSTLRRRDGVRYPVLVPNMRGLLGALDLDVREIAVFASATESFSKANLGRGVDAALAMFAPVIERARADGLAVRAYVSMCFGDPWEGDVPIAAVVRVARALIDQGATELSLGDTIGTGTPGHVTALLGALGAAGIGPGMLAVHFHDTYGQALANTVAAMQAGITVVDAAAGGIGGCPFARSATGNLATEDLVWALHGMGVATGIDLEAVLATSVWMAERLGRPSPSRVVRALSAQE